MAEAIPEVPHQVPNPEPEAIPPAVPHEVPNLQPEVTKAVPEAPNEPEISSGLTAEMGDLSLESQPSKENLVAAQEAQQSKVAGSQLIEPVVENVIELEDSQPVAPEVSPAPELAQEPIEPVVKVEEVIDDSQSVDPSEVSPAPKMAETPIEPVVKVEEVSHHDSHPVDPSEVSPAPKKAETPIEPAVPPPIKPSAAASESSEPTPPQGETKAKSERPLTPNKALLNTEEEEEQEGLGSGDEGRSRHSFQDSSIVAYIPVKQ